MKTIIILLLLTMIVCSQTKPDRSPAKKITEAKSKKSSEIKLNKSVEENIYEELPQTYDINEVKSPEKEISNLLILSDEFYKNHNIEKAITYIRQLLTLIADNIKMDNYHLKVEKLLAFYLSEYALELTDEFKYSEAEFVFKEALELFRRIYKGQDHLDLVMSINDMAGYFEGQSRYNEAESLYKESLEMRRRIFKGQDHPELATSINNMALYFNARGKYTEAEPQYKEALEMFRRIFNGQDHPDLATSINNMAAYLNDRGRYTEAEPLYKEALEMNRRIYKGQDHPDLATSINNMASYLNTRGRHTEAEPLYKEALEMRKRIYKDQDHLDLASSINNMAFYFNARGRYTEAEPLYKESLEMRRRIYKGQDHPDLALSINNMAFYFNARGRFTEAEPLYKEALEMYGRIFKDQDHPDLTACTNNMANYLNDRGRYTEAEPLYKESLEMRRRIYKDQDHPFLSHSINNMALYLHDRGRYTEAEPLYKEALEMNRRIYKDQDHPDLAMSINNMGFYLSDRGRYTEAETLYKEALEMYRRIFKVQDHPDLARSLNNMAAYLKDRGRYTEAESLYKESLEMYKRIYKGQNHPDLATSINNMATYLHDRGRYTAAESLYKESLEMYRRIFKGQDHPDLARSINNMALFLNAGGRYTEAESLYKESLEMYKRIYKGQAHPDLTMSINNMAFYLNDRGRYTEAVSYFLEWNEMERELLKSFFYYLNEKEKGAFLSTFIFRFEIFNSIAINHYKDRPELLKTMYANQLLIKGIIGQSAANLRRKVEESVNAEISIIFDKWIEMKELIASMYSKTTEELKTKGMDLKESEKEANELEKELSSKIENLFEERNAVDLTWENVQSKLKDNEAAIELVRFQYHHKQWTDTVYYAALILTKETKDKPEIVLLENGNELEGTLFSEYKDYVEVSKYLSKGEDVSDDGKLYKEYWSRIAESIKGKTRVYLSNDGVYNQINLNSLFNPETGKYLIDETELVTLTNTREIAIVKKEKKTKNKAELFGYPNYNLGAGEQIEVVETYKREDIQRKRLMEGVSLKELPGTKEEIEETGKLLKKNNWGVNEYIGDKAIEEALKEVNSPRVLHIATHGAFIDEEKVDREREYSGRMIGEQEQRYYDNPLLRSALFLTGANRSRKGIKTEGMDDGVFTGYEAQNLNLSGTELVILSACETGLGVVKSGEGVYGLQRAFQVAGAKYIIMSLWNVSDEATKVLILNFYRKWVSGKSVPAAFKEAQSELRQNYPGAYYWAAFVLIGNETKD